MTAAVTQLPYDSQECWCCGRRLAEDASVRLGNHPEVAVCLACAHFLHRQARALEDARRASLTARVQGVLRSARGLVMEHRWHQAPVIGPLLRWVGRWTP